MGETRGPSIFFTFFIEEDVLSRALSLSLQQGNIKSLRVVKDIVLQTHVLYGDDIMIFYQGNKQSLHKILRIFNEYGMVFEKIISKDKIRLYASAMILQRASNIHTLLWFNQGQILISYIGCPIFKGKPKQIHFQSIVLKIRTKLVSWKGILLSIKGITQLIKSIIQGMLIYYFPIYLWPTKVLT